MNSIVVLLLIGLLTADSRERVWDFSKDEVGKKPAGFYFDDTGRAPDGRWRVLEEERQEGEEGKKNHVLAQLDESRDRGRFALAVIEKSSIKNLKLSVRMKAVKGDLDQAGGIVWRYRNSENYLVARLDVSERNVRLYRFVGGNRVQFGVAQNLDVHVGQWYTLRIEHRGEHVKVYLDEDALFIEKDRHFRRPGRIALWTKADSVIHFDDLKAINLDGHQDGDGRD